MTTSKASATWTSGLKSGRGHFKAGSGAFAGEYTFATRFEGARGTTPEELIAAAHASCLSMALSAALEKAGKTPERVTVDAACTLDMVEGAPKITAMRLQVRAKVPGMDAGAFAKAAEDAKNNCPVSKALKQGVKLELEAKLES